MSFMEDTASDESDSIEDSSNSEDEGRVCGCDRCYEGSTETCRACSCSGCETEEGPCMYPNDSDDEDRDTPKDIRYWEKKAHDNEDTVNYLRVDLRNEVTKTVNMQTLCNRRTEYAKNERIRMKASFKEKVQLLEYENKHQAESFKEIDDNLIEVLKDRHGEILDLQEELNVKQEEIDKLQVLLSTATEQLKADAPKPVKKPARKRARGW
jgi:hypothetical protein